MPRQRILYPCSNCSVSFALNSLQAARVRKNPNAPVFCGRKCAGVSKSPQAKCAQCNKPFDPLPEQRRKARAGALIYCSRGCFHTHRVTFKCEKCETVFITTPNDRRRFARESVLCASCRRRGAA